LVEEVLILITTLRRKGYLTIPAEIRRAAKLEEGDELEIEIVDDGLFIRRHDVDRDPPYYGTPEWDAKVKEALDAVEAGETVYYDSDEEFLASFK
jgi:AbrB family looped-hinge helix DNA binding protein